jgi:hypothetical protein
MGAVGYGLLGMCYWLWAIGSWQSPHPERSEGSSKPVLAPEERFELLCQDP